MSFYEWWSEFTSNFELDEDEENVAKDSWNAALDEVLISANIDMDQANQIKQLKV